MNPKRIFLFIFIAYCIGSLAHAAVLGKTVYGDGMYYYSWLRSIIIDRDIHFQNDYQLFGITQKTTPTGLLGNIYPIGPALFWSPAFAWTHAILRGNGVGLTYQLIIALTSVMYAMVGLILLFRILRHFASESSSLRTVMAIAFGTHLLFYGSLDTVNSHAISFALSSFFLLLWLQPKRNNMLLGSIVGCMALIRPQDALFGLLLFHKTNARSLAKNALGYIIVYSLQLIAWQLLYGTFWTSPYLDSGYGFTFLQPKLLQVLFSPNNGLFLWTPMTLLGLLGLLLSKFPKPHLKPFLLGVVLLQIYLVASWTTWWQGESFSGRMFISSLPILAIGLTRFYIRITAPLIIINLILIVLYLLSH